MVQEKRLYELLKTLDEGKMNRSKISVHDIAGIDDGFESERFRLYHSGGFACELLRERAIDDGDDSSQIDCEVDDEGFWYNYTDLSEDGTGYKFFTVNMAIKEVLNEGVFA